MRPNGPRKRRYWRWPTTYAKVRRVQGLDMESKFGSRRKAGSSQAILGVVLSSLLLGALLVGYFFYWNNDDAAVQGEPQAIAASGSDPAAQTAASTGEADKHATVAE